MVTKYSHSHINKETIAQGKRENRQKGREKQGLGQQTNEKYESKEMLEQLDEIS